MKEFRRFLLALAFICPAWAVSSAQGLPDKSYSVPFSKHNTLLSRQARVTIDSIAEFLKAQPDYNLQISYMTVCKPRSNENAITWARANRIVELLIIKYGLNPERFMSRSDEGADVWSEIKCSPTLEKIETAASPPHPNLRKKVEESPSATNPSINY